MWLKPTYRQSQAGATLIEVIISTGLLSLVLVATSVLVSFAVRWNAKMRESVDTYQHAINVYSRISHDLGTGSRDSFIYAVDGFAFASARPGQGVFTLDSSGRLLWHRYIIYYVEGDTLYRHELPIEPPTASLPITPDMATLRSRLSGQGKKVAENFSNLEVEPGSGATIKFRIDGDNVREENFFNLESRMTFRQ